MKPTITDPETNRPIYIGDGEITPFMIILT